MAVQTGIKRVRGPRGGVMLRPEKGQRPAGSGVKKGQAHKTTTLLKEACLLAAEQTGEIKQTKGRKMVATGKDGLVGYLRWAAMAEPKAFIGLLARILPLQITDGEGKSLLPVYRERRDILSELNERGIPVTAIFGAISVDDPPIDVDAGELAVSGSIEDDGSESSNVESRRPIEND